MYSAIQDVTAELELCGITYDTSTNVDHSVTIYIGFQGMAHEVTFYNFDFVTIVFNDEPMCQFSCVKDFLNSWLWQKLIVQATV